MSFRKKTFHGPTTGALPADSHIPFESIKLVRRAANEAIKRSEDRMASRVKFTPRCDANRVAAESLLKRIVGTPVSNG